MEINLTKIKDGELTAKDLSNFCGSFDENLRAIENKFEIKIIRQNFKLILTGANKNLENAKDAIIKILSHSHKTLNHEKINTLMMESQMNKKINTLAPKTLRKNPGVKADINNFNEDNKINEINEVKDFAINLGRKIITARTINQLKYLQNINREDMVFGVGPAGTGKTYLAVAASVVALEQSLVQRIVLTRPALEAGERLGFLPGTLAEKVDPYLRPVYDALYDCLGVEKFNRYMADGTIEIAPLAFMRGRTLNEAFVILDEAQNTTSEQMKMFLTRVGFGSKVVINGDLTQTDLPLGKQSGLSEACEKLKKITGIAFVYFNHTDVVRHPLVARIIKAYDKGNS